MRQKIRQIVIMLTVIALAAPLVAHATVVGRFTLVRGQVDLLKQGKIPAVAAKLQDGVEPGDIIRTKSRSKAQLKMVDDSVITLAPLSRLAIADYQYNPDREERRAVLRIFRGLVHTVVTRIIKREEPDFIVETHTAVIGVRGTDWYTLLGPSLTLAALRYGTLSVSPTVAGLAPILLHSMQYIQVPKPFVPQVLTPEMIKMLETMMDTGVTAGDLYSGTGSAKGGEFPFQLPVSPEQLIRLQTIPPTLAPKPQEPAPSHPAPTPVQPVTPTPTPVQPVTPAPTTTPSTSPSAPTGLTITPGS
jgi:hypothetical protein